MDEGGAAGRAMVGCVLQFILGASGLALHVWTVVIAATQKGLWAAVLSFFLPVFAEGYWGIARWHATGTLANPYCLGIIAFVALMAADSMRIILGGLTKAR